MQHRVAEALVGMGLRLDPNYATTVIATKDGKTLRDQLVVTYARPQSGKPAEKIEIAVKRRGVKVRAPKWVRRVASASGGRSGFSAYNCAPRSVAHDR